MTLLRHQLPVRSPVSFAALVGALVRRDARSEVEATLREAYGATHVVVTDSGTSALLLVLRAAVARRPGGLCLLPGYGCYDLATAALGARVRVALYDVDPDTLAPRADQLRALARSDCAAIVVVHPHGIPIDLRPAIEVARRTGATLVEDAAQAAGARWGGERVGRLSDTTILSFGRGKGVTGGAGGAILLRGDAAHGLASAIESPLPEVPARAALLTMLKLAAMWALGRPALYILPASLPGLHLGEALFHEPSAPRRLSRLSANVLASSGVLPDGEVAIRRRHAETLQLALADILATRGVRLSAEATASWLRLPIRFGRVSPDRARRAARLGILPSYPQALADLAPLRDALAHVPDTPGARLLARTLWTLPTHGAMSGRDLARVAAWVRDADADTRGDDDTSIMTPTASTLSPART